uniref:hypothetical protein n=1 Tax=Prevotella sp. TaxID=59823 RepID=UPI004027F938
MIDTFREFKETKNIDYNKQYIKRLLENDIVAAYYYQGGAIRNSLRYDKQVKEAVRLLNTPEEYKKLLRPSEKEGEKVHK